MYKEIRNWFTFTNDLVLMDWLKSKWKKAWLTITSYDDEVSKQNKKVKEIL